MQVCLLQSLGHTYAKKLFIIYLKFKMNWALCIFPYVLNLAILVKSPESQVREDFCPSPPMHVTLGKNAESEGDPHLFSGIGDLVTLGQALWG